MSPQTALQLVGLAWYLAWGLLGWPILRYWNRLPTGQPSSAWAETWLILWISLGMGGLVCLSLSDRVGE